MIIHAMTRFGLMHDPDVAYYDNNVSQEATTCELVFEEVGIFNGDYHNCFNGEKFIGWVKYRLLPTFHKLYPSKKMTLIMDNASYHKPAGLNTFRPSSMKKVECTSFFSARSIDPITVPRKDGSIVQMSAKNFEKNQPQGIPWGEKGSSQGLPQTAS